MSKGIFLFFLTGISIISLAWFLAIAIQGVKGWWRKE